MEKKQSFKILITGLQNVGKSTIKQKFDDGLKDFNENINKGAELKNGERALNSLDITLDIRTISSKANNKDEYKNEKQNDLDQYQIVIIVYDLEQKDSIKEIAQTIQDGSLNFEKLSPNTQCVLWGNKDDLFDLNRNNDERTAQKMYELENDYKMLSFVRCNSINKQKNEPFEYIMNLIEIYSKQMEKLKQINIQSQTSDTNGSEINKIFIQNNNTKKQYKRKVEDDSSFSSGKQKENCNILSTKYKESKFDRSKDKKKNKNKKDKQDDDSIQSGECRLI